MHVCFVDCRLLCDIRAFLLGYYFRYEMSLRAAIISSYHRKASAQAPMLGFDAIRRPPIVVEKIGE